MSNITIYHNPACGTSRNTLEMIRNSGTEPTIIYYDHKESGVTTTIGKDACYYHPDAENVMWNEEVQPYGYAGVKHLCEKLLEV